MLDEISNNSPSHHSHHHKKGLIASLFHHHHHHHSHSHSHSSTSKSIPSTSSSLSVHSVSPSLSEAEQIITKWDPNSSSYTKVTSLFQQSRKEAREFVEAVKSLRGTMNGLAADRDSTAELVLAQQLMQTAMKRLERELHQILSESRDRLDPESISSRSSSAASSLGTTAGEEEEEDGDEVASANGSIAEVERVSALATADVKSIAECMISCGYGKECIKIYKTLRKSIVDEGMFRLRVERFRASQVQKLGHDALAAAVKVWVNAAKVAVTTLFKGEKNLCDRVLASASDTVRESCFREIAEEAAENLFRFPEMAAAGKGGPKKSPERIFPLMELYETFSDIWPEMESVFGPGVLSHALASSLKLRDSIHSILPEIESAIHHTPSKSLPAGGATHPMTQWVMEYITKLADHGGVLSGILTDYPPLARDSRLEESSSSEPVSIHLMWLVLVLLCKLDSKAELYKDASLSYLFLANNLQFVVETVKSTSLRYILGEEWVARHEKKVHQYAASYESMAWTKVYFTLPEHTGDVSPGESKEVLGRFTAAFEDEYKKQTGWIVQDGKLRDELKVSIAKKLVPRYRDFYYESNFAGTQWLSPDDIGNYLSDLFHGPSTTASFNFSSPSLSPVSSPRKGLSR